MNLKSKSIAIFGGSSERDAGHVVFVEAVFQQTNTVLFSECNYGYAGGTVALSNGEIEVPNAYFTEAGDSVIKQMDIDDFMVRTGSGLIGVIHKK